VQPHRFPDGIPRNTLYTSDSNRCPEIKFPHRHRSVSYIEQYSRHKRSIRSPMSLAAIGCGFRTLFKSSSEPELSSKMESASENCFMEISEDPRRSRIKSFCCSCCEIKSIADCNFSRSGARVGLFSRNLEITSENRSLNSVIPIGTGVVGRGRDFSFMKGIGMVMFFMFELFHEFYVAR